MERDLYIDERKGSIYNERHKEKVRGFPILSKREKEQKTKLKIDKR